MKLKNPREENGPDGYPKDNPEFRRLADLVVERRRQDAEQARRFLTRLAELTREK